MSFPKVLLMTAIVLFGGIGVAALFKKGKLEQGGEIQVVGRQSVVEIDLEGEERILSSVGTSWNSHGKSEEGANFSPQKVGLEYPFDSKGLDDISASLPEVNRIEEFFNKGQPQFPIVETVTYKSRVSWLKGRPAWISDYASHYRTSRHFIARSLNGKPDYFKQDVAEGDRFNVLAPDKNIEFYLLIDISRSKMWFYCFDLDTNERVLVKTYSVGLGRIESSSPSGLLTPIGKYTLGDKIAIYRPKVQGYHNGEKIEMIRIFGTRWIPFDKEISGCTSPAKGLGIHGIPWLPNGMTGELEADYSSIGKYQSDGCIRLTTEDIEELFAIIITKPVTVELVKDFYDAHLPGEEKR